MPYAKRDALASAYRRILATAHAGQYAGPSTSRSTAPVLLLVAPDVDAVCAARGFVKLLADDRVGYIVRPVSGWTDLSRINSDDIEGNDELRVVVLLNIGGLVDLSEYLSLPPQAELHVLDSHRPWNLNNVFDADADQVCVWDDGDIDEGMQAEREAFEALQYEPDEDSEGSDSDDDMPRRRRDDSDDDEDESSHKRRRLEDGEAPGEDGQPRMSRKQKRTLTARINKYYNSGTYYGHSIANLVFMLATQLNRVDNDLLWLAILGLTYQFTTGLIDNERYERYSAGLGDEVARLNVTGADPPPEGATSGSSPTDRSIRPSIEFRFMLFRHWNLYDAMYHSSYVAGKLRLWRERGRKNLQGLLAKMGFSLLQCQQTYAHMDMELKRTLRHKVESFAPEYGLSDLSFPSFVRAAGYQSLISAADAVEGVGALLEAAHGVRLDFAGDGLKTWPAFRGRDVEKRPTKRKEPTSADKENRRPNGVAAQPAPNQPAAAGALAEAAKEDDSPENTWWVKSFFAAWDALSPTSNELRASLQLSMALHRTIIRQGTSLLDKQAIKTLRTFRLAVLKEGPDLPIFGHPATLARLAIWLVDALRDLIQNGPGGAGDAAAGVRKKKGLPLVVAALDERRDSFMVVGVSGAAEFGDVRKNRFNLAFQVAAEASGTDVRFDRFEASIVEVGRDDLPLFLDRLLVDR